MHIILRAYVGTTCVKDPEEIVKAVSKPTTVVELDIADEKGHVKMSDTDELAGETVKVGEFEIQIPSKQPTP